MEIGIISDIHEDVESLRLALKLLQKSKCDEIVCLGDIVGYSVPHYNYLNTRNASECISIVRSTCSVVISGNHDLYAIRKLSEFRNEFQYPDNWFELDFRERKKISEDKLWLYEDEELSPLLNKSDRAYLDSLPEYAIKEYGGINFLFSHYLYPDISGSERTWRSKRKEIRTHVDFIKQNKCRIGISGHTHTEGYLSGSVNGFKWKDFGKHLLKKNVSWIVGPCIAGSSRANGFMIFDTDSFELEVIQLLN